MLEILSDTTVLKNNHAKGKFEHINLRKNLKFVFLSFKT